MKKINYSTKMVEDFLEIAIPVCTEGRVRLMHKFIQHGRTSCLEHCIAVAFYSVLLVEAMGIKYDRKSIIRGALLHDYFLYDWHLPHGRGHGFTHPGIALKNATRDFELTEIEKNIIVRHMFPLVPIPPKSVEGGIVCLIDKWCSVRETFHMNIYENDEVIQKVIKVVERKIEEDNRKNVSVFVDAKQCKDLI